MNVIIYIRILWGYIRILFAKLVKCYLTRTRAQLIKIAIKLRPQKWGSGARQNNKFVKIIVFYLFCENRKTRLCWHQSATYYKMTINLRLQKGCSGAGQMTNSWKLQTIEKSQKLQHAVWSASGAINRARRQKTGSGTSSVYRYQMVLSSKTTDIAPQDADKTKQPHQQ